MWHIFWRGYSRLRSGREHWAWMVVVEVRQGTLGGDTRGWGPAGNTGRGWSWLRSGREHWAGMVVVEVRQGTLGGDDWAVMVVVEVRQGTLGVDGRGWGPAGNTGRGWSWLRSGREHWAWMVMVEVRQGTLTWMVVVEVRQRTLWIAGRSWTRRTRRTTRRTTRRRRGGGEEERRRRGREEEEQATDIKSNNPHLAGGEKTYSAPYHCLPAVLECKQGTYPWKAWASDFEMVNEASARTKHLVSNKERDVWNMWLYNSL